MLGEENQARSGGNDVLFDQVLRPVVAVDRPTAPVGRPAAEGPVTGGFAAAGARDEVAAVSRVTGPPAFGIHVDRVAPCLHIDRAEGEWAGAVLGARRQLAGWQTPLLSRD